MKVLFELCGGAPRKRLLEYTGKQSKALIEIEPGRPLFSYGLNAAIECNIIDEIIVSGPPEIKSFVPENKRVYFSETGKTILDTARKCFKEIKGRYIEDIIDGNLSVTFLFGDTPLIEPDTIDLFIKKATDTKCDIAFQCISKKDYVFMGDKTSRFIYLRDLKEEITATNMLQFNISGIKKAECIERILFREGLESAANQYYRGMGTGPVNFFASMYRAASHGLGFFTATYLLVNAGYRYAANHLDEAYLSRLLQMLFGLDMAFVRAAKPFDVFDIDQPEDLQYARELLLKEKPQQHL